MRERLRILCNDGEKHQQNLAQVKLRIKVQAAPLITFYFYMIVYECMYLSFFLLIRLSLRQL